jgi:hypothetical protein
MNEFVQENLRDVGIDLEIIPIEWNALTQRFRQGLQHPDNAQLGAMNVSFNFLEPWSAFTRFFHSASIPPKSVNVMPYLNPEVDRLIEAAEQEFDLSQQDRILTQVHERIVEDAPLGVHRARPQSQGDEPQSKRVCATAVVVCGSHTAMGGAIACGAISSDDSFLAFRPCSE